MDLQGKETVTVWVIKHNKKPADNDLLKKSGEVEPKSPPSETQRKRGRDESDDQVDQKPYFRLRKTARMRVICPSPIKFLLPPLDNFDDDDIIDEEEDEDNVVVADKEEDRVAGKVETNKDDVAKKEEKEEKPCVRKTGVIWEAYNNYNQRMDGYLDQLPNLDEDNIISCENDGDDEEQEEVDESPGGEDV